MVKMSWEYRQTTRKDTQASQATVALGLVSFVSYLKVDPLDVTYSEVRKSLIH